MPKTHHYELTVTWTGNTGAGTSGYQAFERSHEVSSDGKPTIPGSADPAFRGARDRWNPEELLVASLSQCHMLWYLVLCAKEGIATSEKMERATALHERAHALCYVANSVNFRVRTEPTVVSAAEA